MAELLTTGCTLSCSFGAAPSVFVATPLPGAPTLDEILAAATMIDFIPLENIPTFGMCSSPANPEVAAATAAALGVLTPMPCLPMTLAPWAPPSVILMADGMPHATVESMCECVWGGLISVELPTAFNVTTDA